MYLIVLPLVLPYVAFFILAFSDWDQGVAEVVQMVINMYHGGPDACPFLGTADWSIWVTHGRSTHQGGSFTTGGTELGSQSLSSWLLNLL